ncbi:MAG: type II toxin-antitoxin system VapC family toxin [Armatimonadota bacterium]
MRPRALRVYVDTSVFGGAFDDLFLLESQRFFSLARAGQFQIVTSGLVTVEISRAPTGVQAWYDEWLPAMEVVDVTNIDALRLARAYVEAGIVTPRWQDDAMHVAYATISGCQLIVSWNFKHIVNYQKVPQYNAVNVLQGYGAIAIHSPMEVVTNEEENV